MICCFRTATGKKVRVQVSEEEAMREWKRRLAMVTVPLFWIFAFARAAGMI